MLVPILTGHTASGKTRVSLALARNLPLEIISMDSRMVYRGMDIGTAKPSREERAVVPHHLIDIRDPDQPYSLYEFLKDVATLVPEITARGRFPLIVGGTMLYLKALVSGWRLGPPPWTDEERARLLEEEKKRPGTLFEYALKANPERARRLSPRDYPRLIRAIEGTPAAPPTARPPFEFAVFALIAPRELAYRLVAKRVREQLDRGLVDEVRGLVEKYGPSCRALRAIAYQEFLPYLNGEISLEESAKRLERNNRRLVKHQMTWLHQIPHKPIPVTESSTPDALASTLYNLIRVTWDRTGSNPRKRIPRG